MATEKDYPDSEDVKKKALVRLAVAGLVTAAALAGLWWLDRGQSTPASKPALQPQPAPIRPAESLPAAPPQAETPPQPDTEPGVPTMDEGEAADRPATPAAPPPPRVVNAPSMPALAPAPKAGPAAGKALTGDGEPSPPPPSAPMPATGIGAPARGSLVVQMGVFSNPARAEELVGRLRAQGIQAHTETRVYVGPFRNREEALKAQAEMRRQGMEGLITTVVPTK